MLKNEIDLKKTVQNIAFGNKIFIAMGAGSITNWVRNLNWYGIKRYWRF